MEQLTTSAYLRFFESKVGLLRGRVELTKLPSVVTSAGVDA